MQLPSPAISIGDRDQQLSPYGIPLLDWKTALAIDAAFTNG
ncbi:MAG: hypothetical protein AAF889_09515 [Cyanobacteria bacterium P01_D01_bin.73]